MYGDRCLCTLHVNLNRRRGYGFAQTVILARRLYGAVKIDFLFYCNTVYKPLGVSGKAAGVSQTRHLNSTRARSPRGAIPFYMVGMKFILDKADFYVKALAVGNYRIPAHGERGSDGLISRHLGIQIEVARVRFCDLRYNYIGIFESPAAKDVSIFRKGCGHRCAVAVVVIARFKRIRSCLIY